MVIAYFELDLEGNYDLFFNLRDRLIKEGKNSYINFSSLKKNKYSFHEFRPNCNRFFKIKHLGKKLYLVGGVMLPNKS